MTVTPTATSTYIPTATPTGSVGSVGYVYDADGRLVAAYDPAGDAAVYQYDAVGNLLSITNYPSTAFAGIDLSSGSGATGSSLTIYGTDFCSSPTVTINGTNATVTSSSSTQIVVVIPSGATSGPVVVTCGSNEVNLGSFNVTASTAISITGFTPGIGSPGTSVTISGTNFQTNPANDKVGFNYAPAAVSSATSTSITAIVPSNATSGHIFVDTHYSQAFSANSFYVPPSGVSSSNVVTGQMTIGGSSVTSTLSTAGNVGLYTFYGTGGQQISLNITNESFNGSNWADFSIVAPGGSTIASLRAWQSDNIIAQVNLRTTGSYTVVVAPEGTNTGSVTLQLLNTAEVNGGTISIGGSAVNVPTANPGQYTALTFSGTAAEQISLNITNESFNGSNWADFYILPPGGTIASPTASLRAWTASNIISNVILPTTGTYTVVVAPEGYNTGTVTLQLFDTAPVNGGTISIGGSAVNVASANPGQYTDLTFSGTAGAQISLNITNESFNGSNWADFYIVPPGGTIASPTASLRNWVSTNIIANVILPSTGTYTIVVAPEGYNTGTVTLQLFDTAEQTGTISLGGPPVNVTSPTPGQYTALTFSGTAGQQVSLYITNESFGGSNWADFYIVPPGGTISSPTASLRAWVPVSIIPNITLPTTGTYTVVVAPEGNNVGSVTLQLFDLSSGNLPVRGTFSDGNPNGTSISLTLPSSIQPGDISVVGIVSASTDATFTPPTGWTTLLNAGSNGVFYRIYQTGDSTTIAFTASESNWLTAQGITYTGVDQTNPIDSFNSWIFQGNGTTSPGYSRAPTLNPNYNGDQLLCGFLGDASAGAAFSVPTGLTLRTYDTPGPNIEFADKPLTDGTATGDFDATGGLGSDSNSPLAGFQLALKVAGSSAATAEPVPPSIGGEMAYGWLSANAPISPNLSSLSIQNNDLVIVAFVPDDSSSIDAPTGYTSVETPDGNAAIFQHLWQTGDSTTPSFSFSGSSGYVVPFVWVIRGSGTGSAPQIDQHAFDYSASATSLGAPSLTPTTNSDLLLLLFGNDYNSGGSWQTVPTGPTFDVDYGGGPNDLVGSLLLTNEDPTSEYTADFSVSGQMWAFAIAVEVP